MSSNPSSYNASGTQSTIQGSQSSESLNEYGDFERSIFNNPPNWPAGLAANHVTFKGDPDLAEFPKPSQVPQGPPSQLAFPQSSTRGPVKDFGPAAVPVNLQRYPDSFSRPEAMSMVYPHAIGQSSFFEATPNALNSGAFQHDVPDFLGESPFYGPPTINPALLQSYVNNSRTAPILTSHHGPAVGGQPLPQRIDGARAITSHDSMPQGFRNHSRSLGDGMKALTLESSLPTRSSGSHFPNPKTVQHPAYYDHRRVVAPQPQTPGGSQSPEQFVLFPHRERDGMLSAMVQENPTTWPTTTGHKKSQSHAVARPTRTKPKARAQSTSSSGDASGSSNYLDIKWSEVVSPETYQYPRSHGGPRAKP